MQGFKDAMGALDIGVREFADFTGRSVRTIIDWRSRGEPAPEAWSSLAMLSAIKEVKHRGLPLSYVNHLMETVNKYRGTT